MSELIIRFEVRCRHASLDPGLSARVYDPAWLLCRQWVFGEFDGDDGGTPVQASMELEGHALDRLSIAGSELTIDATGQPLDGLAERLRSRSRVAWTTRERCNVGRELIRQLRQRGLDQAADAVIDAYALDAPDEELWTRDPEGAVLLAAAAGRLPDGEQIYREVGAAGDTLAGLPASTDLAAALEEWRTWLRDTLAEPLAGGGAWQPDRLEYAFAVSATSRAGLLAAREHRGGGLDWHAFDAAAGPAATGAPARARIELAPTPVTFRGMPNPRYWEMEDASIDLGAVDAAPSDLARMALLEFSFVFGNDVFAIPAALRLGNVHEVTRLRIVDTFGDGIDVPPALRQPGHPAGAWSFLATAGEGGTRSGGLLVPHVAAHALNGTPLEDVIMLRDEMANLVWAVERRIEGGAGTPLVRAEAEARALPAQPPPDPDAPLEYRLQSGVPPSWFPLVLRGGLPPFLQLARLSPSLDDPRGSLLPAVGGVIHEGEVPREGVAVEREYVCARCADGSTYVWARHRRRVGRGEGSSGLRFDTIEPRP